MYQRTELIILGHNVNAGGSHKSWQLLGVLSWVNYEIPGLSKGIMTLD